MTVRHHGHVLALEKAVLAAHTTAPLPSQKERIPPGPEAWAGAQALHAQQQPTNPADADVVVDLATYPHAAKGKNTLS